MAQAALTKPEYFLNMWGRPLGIIFFSIPSQFGYWYCAAATAVLSIFTCYLTYRAASISQRRHAWLAIIFLSFQPLFFITSFSLCTEQLAAFFLAAGLYSYYRKSYVASSLLLSFMSLARTELVLLLPIFAVALFKEKKYFHILLLGVGLLLFQIAGMIATGDRLFLLTAAKSAGHGLYQNVPFEHYFQRFIFIVGPVIFAFMTVQLVVDIKDKRFSLLNVSVVLMFFVHVYLSWKGNVASIGFLRHFVAIAPMMALWALEGFNNWFLDKQSLPMAIDNSKLILLVLAGVTTIVGIYYSFDLVGDYFLSNDKEYLKFFTVLVILLMSVMNKFLNITNATMKRLMLFTVVLGTVIYTLVKEKPLQLAPEHQTVKNFHSYFKENLKDKVPMTMVVHPWFFFFDNFNYYKQDVKEGKYLEMRKEKLDELPVGGIVIWDTHYSWRLSSNVQPEDLTKNPNFKFNQELISPDRKFAIYVFEKVKA